MSEQIEVRVHHGSTERKTTLEIGGEYIVKPRNPQKEKHRDRPCVILDFVPVSEQHPRDVVAKVRFLDNNRMGRAELGDLVPPSKG
jgi:hypothetical protein